MATLRLLAICSVFALPLTALADTATSELCGGEKGAKEPTAEKGDTKPDAAKPGDKPSPDKPADKPAGDQTGKS